MLLLLMIMVMLTPMLLVLQWASIMVPLMALMLKMNYDRTAKTGDNV